MKENFENDKIASLSTQADMKQQFDYMRQLLKNEIKFHDEALAIKSSG